MKILTTGLDAITIQFLETNGFVVEPEDIEDADDLVGWLSEDMYRAFVCELDETGLGLYISREVREKMIKIPIIGLACGRDDMTWSDQRALFLENGGDDLIRKPATTRELVASIRAAVRRFLGSQQDIISVEKSDVRFKVNLTTLVVSVNEQPIDLTARERMMLVRFLQSPGYVLTRQQLQDDLYHEAEAVELQERTIDSHVKRLRKKLRMISPGAAELICTIYGDGYVFAPH